MSEVEMDEANVTDIGQEWLLAVRQSDFSTEEFRALLMKHLAKYVFECFELQSLTTLRSVVNEEKCQELIFSPMEYFLCGEDPKVGLEKLDNLNNPPQLCDKVFKSGEPTYSCRYVVISYRYYR